MEGERILSVLKKRSESFESVFKDVKTYLSPVLGEKKKKNALEFEKLELFSLKLFKFCIEQLQRKGERETGSFIQLSSLCKDSLLVCSGSSSKAPPLSFEKILLHLAKFCLSSADDSSSLEHPALGLKVCCVLTDRLNDIEPRKEKKSSEIVNLHKLVYDMLWKAALQFEQRQEVGVAKFCLDLRTAALGSLISSGKFEVGGVFKSAMKVDLRYRRACANSASGCSQQDGNTASKSSQSKKSKESTTSMSDTLNTVLEFHSTLECSCLMTSLVQPSLKCKEFTAGIGYLLHYTTLCLKSTHLRNKGRERLSMTLDLCTKHEEGCDKDGHMIVQAQANCLQLWNTIREEEGNNFLDQSLLYLNILTDSLDDVISSECHHDNKEAVHWLAESLELVFGCLRRRREACRATEREGRASSDIVLVPRSAFQSFKSFILSSVSFLEIMLKILSASSLPAQQEYSIRQNQLVLLSLLADALVDLLCEDDIEVLRSSTSDLLTSLETTPTPHPKQELAECCIPLIKSSQQIIDKAGSDVLSVSERKWVANDAHRLGQALCSCDLLTEACQVLELSCHELTMWCKTGSPSEEVQRSRSREARLLERFINLCSVYCQNGDYIDALATIKKAITSLPANQIAEEETLSLLVGQWVRVKRHLANESSQFMLEDEKSASSGRSLAPALRKVGRISDDIKILYLDSELNLYQSQSYDSHSCEVTVVKELLGLHSLTESHASLLHTARLTTQLSTLCRTCHTHSNCDHAPCEPPLALLDDTVALLEPLVTSVTPSHIHTLTQAHQHLATAYLWKAICTLEQNISSVGVTGISDTSEESRDTEKKIELSLTGSEQSLMMSDDIIQCLFSAVENWEMMREKAVTLNLSMSEIYHDPSSMLHSLHLTATLCLTHSQPVLALRCLDALLRICMCHAPQLTHELLPSYNNAVSLYNDLVLSMLGPRPQLLPKPHPLPSTDLGRRELVEIQCSQMMADLASAQMQLACGGNDDDTRKTLLSMLSEPVLEQASTLTFMFVAKAKLLASEILQQRNFDLQPSDAFLHYVTNNSDQSGTDDEGDGVLFQLTPLELAVDAVKIYQKLANHRSVKIEQENHDSQPCTCSSNSHVETDLNRGFSEDLEDTPTKGDETMESSYGGEESSSAGEEGGVESSLLVSSSVGAWDILIGLMSSLKRVSRLYLEQGIVKEAHHYAREGAMLARGLLLPGWYTEFLLLLCEIECVRGEYDLSTQYCLQAASLLECHTHCKHLLAMQTEQGQIAVGEATSEGQSTVRGATRNASSSCVKKIDYETSFDDDSFLEQMENLGIHTPPISPQDSTEIIKGISPSLPIVELHPQACLCQVCTNPQSLLHTARLVVQCCNVALMQTKVKLEKENSSVSLARIHLVADALVSLRDMASKRIKKCDKVLESVSIAGAVERNEIMTIGGGKERPRAKGSSRSTKTGSQRSKKSSKSLSTFSSESTHCSIAESAEFQCLLASIAITKSECSLTLERPKEVITELELALSQLGQGEDCVDKELDIARASLHCQMGMACVQEVELSRPELAAQLYEERVREGDGTKPLVKDNLMVTTSRSKRTRATKKSNTTSSSASTTTRRSRNTTARSNSANKETSRQEAVENPFSLALKHFLACYQLCFPSLPAILTREVCQWVGLLVRGWMSEGGGAEIATHFINAGINCTLTHQTIYCLGKKIRKCSGLGSSPATGKSTRHHIEEIKQSLSTNQPPSQNKLLISPNRALLKGRGLLQQGSTHPPTLSYTQCLRRIYISDCSVSTLCLAPKTHPSRQNFLIIVRASCGDSVATEGEGVAMGVVKLAPELLLEFDSILCLSGESVSLKERREWWGARAKLDKQLKGLILKLESDCLGRFSSLLSPASPELSSVVLVLGRHVQRLPWESLPVLEDNIVCRMPSLSFTAAHRIMLNSGASKDGVAATFDPHSAYYILNPHGDLKNTEKRFANFFSNERGWSGVIGSPPSHEEFSTALQEKDLYVYCGHSVGRFLASSGFQLLNCHATALLAGCSSGRLTISGRCDPTGIPLSYLMAGCPALVGCLWDVTDGEIDRLCHALLKHLLGNSGGEATPLPSLVAASRTACKLQWLTGASAIVYGMPVTPRQS